MSCPSCKSNETRVVGAGADERSPGAFRDSQARNRMCMRCGTVYEEAPAAGVDDSLSLTPRVHVGSAPRTSAPAQFPASAASFNALELTLDSGSKPKATAPGDLPTILLAEVVVLKKCPKCGHSAMVEPSPHAACAGCGRIYAKMEQAMR